MEGCCVVPKYSHCLTLCPAGGFHHPTPISIARTTRFGACFSTLANPVERKLRDILAAYCCCLSFVLGDAVHYCFITECFK